MADILIVEDDVDLASTVADMLAFEGHTTRVAFNGIEGLRAMDERLPELIVLDVEMPLLDGPGMAYAAIADNVGKERIPIIVSSGYSNIDAIADDLGTQYRIAKPCSFEALRNLVQRALSEHHPPSPQHPPARGPTAAELRR